MNMNRKGDAAPPRPRLALAVATGLGLGYLPKAPGTWGSAGGVALVAGMAAASRTPAGAAVIGAEFALIIFLAIGGLWASARVSRFARSPDPPYVVIDELSGQAVALVFGIVLSASGTLSALGAQPGGGFAAALASGLLDWKYLSAGFIIFRVLDIWKPFPARQAESLHGGLGIMADDWIAGAYGALALGVARHLGL